MQLISMITSGMMLGMKIAPIITLPTVWGKLAKWKARLAPLNEAADGAELNTRPQSQPVPVPMGNEEYVAHLLKLQADVAALATRGGPAEDRVQFEKWALRLTMMADKAEDAPSKKHDAPPAQVQLLFDWSAQTARLDTRTTFSHASTQRHTCTHSCVSTHTHVRTNARTQASTRAHMRPSAQTHLRIHACAPLARR
jgi:hypothetical protein